MHLFTRGTLSRYTDTSPSRDMNEIISGSFGSLRCMFFTHAMLSESDTRRTVMTFKINRCFRLLKVTEKLGSVAQASSTVGSVIQGCSTIRSVVQLFHDWMRPTIVNMQHVRIAVHNQSTCFKSGFFLLLLLDPCIYLCVTNEIEQSVT